MAIPVKRYKRRKFLNDVTSPELYYLRREAGSTQVHDLERLAEDIETIGALSTDDVLHVIRAFVRRLKIVLTEGNKVKIDGLGTFYVTFNCTGTEKEKECTVKSIRKVNLRFMVDNKLRLANDSTATTRGTKNNVVFFIKSEAATNNAAPGNGSPGNAGSEDEGFVDPTE